MASYVHERLSAQDRSFLVFEGPHTHMHVGGVTIFESAPLATPAGGVDIERIRSYIASRLHWIPRYRQRLAFVPIENYPVWVDDDRLNLHYHVRHTSLPRPGDERQLKRLAARIMSQQLDRRRPLWEAWIVEGLEGDRFAMVIKTHHCVVDGISGVDLMSVLMRPEPDENFDEPPAWLPRPAPSAFELLRHEVGRRIALPLAAAREAGKLVGDPQQAASRAVENLSAAWEMISAGLRRPADTPLNQPIGPYRRFDWHGLDLADVKTVKNRLGGTVNDVILATVAGALGRFLDRRRTNLDVLDYRAVVPVSVRSVAEQGTMGNQVAAWILSLPIHERNPLRRFATIREITAHLKQSKQAQGVQILTRVAEFADPILALGVRLASRMHPYNLIVTNVPGPQVPLYLLRSRMLAGYPTVPLFEYQALGVATFSYDGKLFWGFNADWDLVPDLHDFVEAIAASFAELCAAAEGTHGKRPPRKALHAPRSRRAASRARG
jgi:diacylglycerol O-acyltransferase / wax synthase